MQTNTHCVSPTNDDAGGEDYDSYEPVDKRSLAPVIQDAPLSEDYPLPPYLPRDYFPLSQLDSNPIEAYNPFLPDETTEDGDNGELDNSMDDEYEDEEEEKVDDSQGLAVPEEDPEQMLSVYEALQRPYPYSRMSIYPDSYQEGPEGEKEDYSDFSIDNGRLYANLINSFEPKKFFYESPTEGSQDYQESYESSGLQKRTNPQGQIDDRPMTLMDALFPEDLTPRKRSDADYDFDDVQDLEEGGESMYYNPDDKPVRVENVFSRNERLDVKKPGPFYINSKNDFFLNKVGRPVQCGAKPYLIVSFSCLAQRSELL